jgi:hypothetical protein
MFNDTVFIKRLVRICYLDRANESITFIWLVRESSVKHNCIEVISLITSDITVL